MAIVFYSWPMSSGDRVRWALDELGLPYEHKTLDRKGGEHRRPEYLAINPNGKVPGLVDGELAYFESLAIILHLGERHGVAKGLWPSTGQARADALSWTVWGVTELHAYMMQFVYHGLDSPVSYGPTDRSRATADYNGSQLQALLDVLEHRLEGREHLLGDFSLADIPAADALFLGGKLGLGVGERPHVKAWLARCAERPARSR